MQWSMNPATLGAYGIGGMDISGVIYTYDPKKELADDFVVTIENDKVGGGFVWQDTEDWSGKHPIRIKKVIPLSYTPLALFGKGRVRTSGTGTLEDVSVIYMYRFDSCFNPQSDPNCPGYVKPKPPAVPKIPNYDALEDDSVKLAQKNTDRKLLEDDEENREEDEEDDNSDIQTLLASTTNALTLANQVAQSAIVNSIPPSDGCLMDKSHIGRTLTSRPWIPIGCPNSTSFVFGTIFETVRKTGKATRSWLEELFALITMRRLSCAMTCRA